MAERSKRVIVLQGIVGVDCPYCAANRLLGRDGPCQHFVIPFVAPSGDGRFLAMLDPQDGRGQVECSRVFDTFDAAADEANAECLRWSIGVGAVVRCYVPREADGGQLLHAVGVAPRARHE